MGGGSDRYECKHVEHVLNLLTWSEYSRYAPARQKRITRDWYIDILLNSTEKKHNVTTFVAESEHCKRL